MSVSPPFAFGTQFTQQTPPLSSSAQPFASLCPAPRTPACSPLTATPTFANGVAVNPIVAARALAQSDAVRAAVMEEQQRNVERKRQEKLARIRAHDEKMQQLHEEKMQAKQESQQRHADSMRRLKDLKMDKETREMKIKLDIPQIAATLQAILSRYGSLESLLFSNFNSSFVARYSIQDEASRAMNDFPTDLPQHYSSIFKVLPQAVSAFTVHFPARDVFVMETMDQWKPTLEAFFSQYGVIADLTLSKGFVVVSFNSEEPVQRLLQLAAQDEHRCVMADQFLLSPLLPGIPKRAAAVSTSQWSQ